MKNIIIGVPLKHREKPDESTRLNTYLRDEIKDAVIANSNSLVRGGGSVSNWYCSSK